MKYKRKSKVIEAFRYNGNFRNAPDWITKARKYKTLFYTCSRLCVRKPYTTLHVCKGDYIINKGNEIGLIRKETFEEMYEQII